MLCADPDMMQMLAAAVGASAAVPPATPLPNTAVNDSAGEELAVDDHVQVLHPHRMKMVVAATGVVANLNLQGGFSWPGTKKFSCKVKSRGLCDGLQLLAVARSRVALLKPFYLLYHGAVTGC